MVSWKPDGAEQKLDSGLVLLLAPRAEWGIAEGMLCGADGRPRVGLRALVAFPVVLASGTHPWPLRFC